MAKKKTEPVAEEAAEEEKYVNVVRIMCSGGDQKGTTFEAGTLTSTYSWLEKSAINRLLTQGQLRPAA